MADNKSVNSSATVAVATREVTYSGDASQHVQAIAPVIVTGSDDAKTASDIVPVSNGQDSTGTGIQAVGIVGQLDDTSTGTVTENQFAPIRISATRRLMVEPNGNVAHDGVDAGNPTKQGGRAVSLGSNPTDVAAADRTDWLFNRAGVPFTLGGHPNIITNSVRLTGSTTDGAIIAGTIATGTKVVVTRLTIHVSNATSVNVGIKVGFGATTLAADSATSAAGVLFDTDGLAPGGGVNIGDGSGIIGIGGDGEEIRVTNDAPTSGAVHVSMSYFTIAG